MSVCLHVIAKREDKGGIFVVMVVVVALGTVFCDLCSLDTTLSVASSFIEERLCKRGKLVYYGIFP